MKRLLLPLLLFVGVLVNAQGNYFKFDAGIGGALTISNFKAYGISASVEPKWFFTETIAAGLRIEGDVLIGGTIDAAAEDVSVGMSTRAAYLLKGEYYFFKSKVRPFVGIGTGFYTIASVSGNSSGEASITAATRTFGFAPEIGVTLNNFRLSALYHVVPGKDIYSVSTGSDIEISRNFLVLQIGFKIFEVGK